MNPTRRLMSTAIVLAVASFGSSPARALDLYSLFDGLYNVTCSPITINVGGVPVQTPPITSVLDLKSFCRTYQVLRSMIDAESFLRQVAALGVKSLVQGPLQGLLDGIQNGLGSSSEYQAFKSNFDAFMNALQDASLALYNLPYRMADIIYENTYSLAYRLGFSAVRADELGRKPDLAPLKDAVAQRTPMSDPEVAAAYGYPSGTDEAKISTGNRAIASHLEDLGAEAAKLQLQGQAISEARSAAEKAAEEAREASERQAVQKSLEESASKVKEIAESASQVTVEINPTTGEKGIAKKFVEDARNAPSDRRLLELQVEAIASLMEQESIYVSQTAELIAQLAKTQLMATMQIADEVRKMRSQSEEARARLSPETAIKFYENQLNSPDPRIEAMDQMTRALCALYNGMQDCPF